MVVDVVRRCCAPHTADAERPGSVPPADHSWCGPSGQDVSRQGAAQDVTLETSCQAQAERESEIGVRREEEKGRASARVREREGEYGNVRGCKRKKEKEEREREQKEDRGLAYKKRRT